MKKNASSKKGSRGGKRSSVISQDPFFESEPKRRKKFDEDEDIVSSEDDFEDDGKAFGGEDKAVEEEEEETAAETRKRLAEAYLEKIRAIASREKENDDGMESGDEDEREGERDSLVAKILQQEQLEESGRVRRLIASRVQKPEESDEFRIIVKHRQSVTAVVLSEDDSFGFSASKDGSIVNWDVESGKAVKYLWPSDHVLKAHGLKDPQGKAKKQSKQVMALAISSDGRYLASGGLDRHIHLWDTRTRGHIQAFPGHRGPVSCLAFRYGTSELFSGSFDRTVKIWNVEDRAYINTLFGHQSEVLTIDCLRKERALTVGRDRTMHLFKVPEESRLVFRASTSSLECGSFINNDEFLSGTDDGSIEHWTVMRKKPVHTVKNAHATVKYCSDEGLSNGIKENGSHVPENNCKAADSWISSISVCRGSDIAASGAGNGSVRLWGIENEAKGIRPLFDLPIVGFANSLAFAKSGKFLVAGIGQEPRLGRWGRVPAAQNGVAIHALKLL